MNRSRLKHIGNETVACAAAGSYPFGGQQISIAEDLSTCRRQSRMLTPFELQDLVDNCVPPTNTFETQFEVHNETTLQGARRLIVEQKKSPALVLNFASAKKPGGGFLNGAQAQEESLARSSALYESLAKFPEFYSINRNCGTSLYTDYMIHSPVCPVFREDDGEFLPAPYSAGFLTTPAVNAGHVAKDEPQNLHRILPEMEKRIDMILAFAASENYEHLVLGAWGCGVFRNDPKRIAPMFSRALLSNDRFVNRFRTVVFSVLDWSAELGIITPFLNEFRGRLSASTVEGNTRLPNARLRPPVVIPERPTDADPNLQDNTPSEDESAAGEVKLLDDEPPVQGSLFD